MYRSDRAGTDPAESNFTLAKALRGITGNKHSLTSAHAIVAMALIEGRRLVVIKVDELLTATSGRDLATRCRRRLSELHLSRGLPM